MNSENNQKNKRPYRMINVAFPAIPLIVHTNKTVALFQTILKEHGIVHCAF